MSENTTPCRENAAKNNALTRFFTDMAAGFGIGVAFIIPGFSGGSVAAILGIYERLIGAIADIFRDFKKSVVTLIPIFIGLCLGAVSLLYPLGWALSAFPLPTVSLFVGLAIGGMFSITEKAKGKMNIAAYLALIIPILLTVLLCFAPTGADVDLFSLDFGGHLLLFAVGILGSCALVIPGISGSMILLILGYYNPLITLVTQHFFKGDRFLECFLVLMATGLGIVVGFIGISMVMKILLKKYSRLTHLAIIGFIVGSVPTVYVSTAKDAGYTLSTLPRDPWLYTVSVLLLIVGFALAFIFVKKAGKLATRKSDCDAGGS